MPTDVELDPSEGFIKLTDDARQALLRMAPAGPPEPATASPEPAAEASTPASADDTDMLRKAVEGLVCVADNVSTLMVTQGPSSTPVLL